MEYNISQYKAETERKISSTGMDGVGIKGFKPMITIPAQRDAADGASRCRRICKYTPELML